jgi:hypothetical protein
LTTAAMLCGSPPPFLTHEVFQRDDQERPQLAFFAVSGIQPAFFKQAAEKFLRKILRVVR